MERELVDKAIVFATKAHEGMYRKGTKLPYILHPLEAAVIVSGMTNDPKIIAGALLHDVLEDTPVTFEELYREFGEVAYLVQSESENKREDQPPESTWHIRKEETILHLKKEDRESVKMIALADKLANIRSIYRDYQVLGEALWERFHEKRIEEHKWYYQELVYALEDLKEYPAYQEYKELVQKVFD